MQRGVSYISASQCRICVNVLLFCLCGANAPARAQEGIEHAVRVLPAPQPMTQDECIAIALRAQPSIHVQEAAYEAAMEVQKQAQSYFLPQLNVTSRYTALDKPLFERITNPLAGPLGEVLGDSAAFFGIARQAGAAAANAALSQPNLPPFSIAKQAALSRIPADFQVEIFGQSLLYNQALVTQPLYAGGKIRYHNQQAKLGIQAAGADLTRSRQQTIFEVTRAYQSILLARELGRAMDDATGQFLAIEKLARSLLEGGQEFVSSADVARARAIRLLAANQKIEFERAADLALAVLRQAMGLDAELPLVIADDRLVLKQVQLEEATILTQALTRRPELIKADLAADNARLQVKLARAQFHPTVGLFGSLTTLSGVRGFPNPGNDYEWQVGVGAEVPIFTGGRNLAGVRLAQHQLQQALETRRVARELVTLEVKQVYLQYKEMAERVGLAEAAVKDAQAALKAFNEQYSGKLIADKDVPRHFENLETTRLLLFTAQARQNQHVYDYNVALGKIRLVTAADD